MDMVRDPKSGIFIPKEVASEIGFGCPKCDDHELVPVAQTRFSIPTIIAKFRKKHAACGPLQTLEKRGDRVYVTGIMPAKTVLLSAGRR